MNSDYLRVARRWTAALLVCAAVALVPAMAAAQEDGGNKPPDVGGEDESLGNNLSTPVVFAEGHGITGLPTSVDTGLRPRPTEKNPTLPFFDPATVVLKENVTYYPQMTTSTWQAGWVDGAPSGEAVIINWGDNLLARTWTTRSVIRVEQVLYQNTTTPLTAYPMTSLFGANTEEVWGTTGTATTSTYRTVYAVTPRLIIEKITGPGGSVVPGVRRFEASVGAAFEDDGPGGYAAEVNGSGNVVYGFNWTLPQWDMPAEQKAGWWRLTFTLDPVAKYTIAADEEGGTAQSLTVRRNVSLAGLDPADLGGEFTYTPRLVNAFTSVLEIEVTAAGGGAGGGGGGGGGGGNPGGGEDPPPADPNDLDSDGLPDVWETLYGIDPTADTATADPDGDGLTNEEEYVAGTHPKGLHSRYFAEGVANGFFSTRFTLLNGSKVDAATVLLRFMTRDGTVLSKNLTLPALGYAFIDAADEAGLADTTFATMLEADTPVAIERTTAWDASGYGSHSSEGATMAVKTWYLAEGATHSGFDLFYLIGNFGGTTADVEITYLRPAPLTPIVKTYTVAPHARLDIWVDFEDEALEDTDVAAVITSSMPIVVDRSMYRTSGGLFFGAGSSNPGTTAPGTLWYFAEGAIGPFFDTFIELLNPGETEAQVKLTHLLPSGSPVVSSHAVPAKSRVTVWVDQNANLPASSAFATVVESTNEVPIVAERSMWWPGPYSDTWLEGHSSAGTPQAGSRWVIGGPSEGAAASSYLLVQNTSTAIAGVEVTIVPEGGTPLTRTFSVAGLRRLDIAIDEATFPGLAGRRFGVFVDSLGTQPAQIVVELSTYVNSGDTSWAAGSTSAGVRIQ